MKLEKTNVPVMPPRNDKFYPCRGDEVHRWLTGLQKEEAETGETDAAEVIGALVAMYEEFSDTGSALDERYPLGPQGVWFPPTEEEKPKTVLGSLMQKQLEDIKNDPETRAEISDFLKPCV